MAKAVTDRIYFTVEHDGIEYNCCRIVSGSRAMEQIILVEGYGQKEDKEFYGAKYKPVTLMEWNAQIIASGIIDNSKNHV